MIFHNKFKLTLINTIGTLDSIQRGTILPGHFNQSTDILFIKLFHFSMINFSKKGAIKNKIIAARKETRVKKINKLISKLYKNSGSLPAK